MFIVLSLLLLSLFGLQNDSNIYTEQTITHLLVVTSEQQISQFANFPQGFHYLFM